jgi:hypothetical protein
MQGPQKENVVAGVSLDLKQQPKKLSPTTQKISHFSQGPQPVARKVV